MNAFLDRKYILALRHRLSGFIQKSANLYNFSCPLCGDGKSGKKKRAYFYLRDNKWWFHCHNECGTMGLKNLLKRLDYKLYQEYELDSFTNKSIINDPIKEEKTAIQYNADGATKALRGLRKVSQLAYDHPCKIYMDSRRIPTPLHSILRWTPTFMQWTNSIIKDKFSKEELKIDHGRLVIPFFSEDNKFFAYIGRVVDNSLPRYILIILNHSIPLIYGMNHIDKNKTIYVLEGPIDTFFLPNSVAMGGSNLSVLTHLNDYDKIVVIDNEPHKTDTVKKIGHAIDLGHKVCIWPKWIKQKDINEMIVAGMSSEYLTKLIKDHSYSGFEAKIKLAEWSKV